MIQTAREEWEMRFEYKAGHSAGQKHGCQKERQRIKEKVKGMKKKIENPDDILGNLKPRGYNQAIDEILTYLND